VDVLADGGASSAGLAIQQVARDKKRIYLICTPTATAFIGKQCSPYDFQFSCDTYALSKVVGGALSKAGGDSWFFITADYEFGTSLQASTEEFVKAAGGRILGSVRAPLGTADFSSYLVQAKASGAKVIGLANAGTDLQNCIKQAAEFGISRNGTRLATLLMIINDVMSLGQDVCHGLVLTNSFYWDLSPETRTWTARYVARMGVPPNEYNAACYAAVTHWLKAVKAAGTLDAGAVATEMRATPLNDFYNKDVHIQANGCVPHAMYLWQVKDPGQSKQKFDVFSRLATLPSPEAYPSPGLYGCPLDRV
jgi:branched-chain amino acid transport system substrate-binding protein